MPYHGIYSLTMEPGLFSSNALLTSLDPKALCLIELSYAGVKQYGCNAHGTVLSPHFCVTYLAESTRPSPAFSHLRAAPPTSSITSVHVARCRFILCSLHSVARPNTEFNTGRVVFGGGVPAKKHVQESSPQNACFFRGPQKSPPGAFLIIRIHTVIRVYEFKYLFQKY